MPDTFLRSRRRSDGCGCPVGAVPVMRKFFVAETRAEVAGDLVAARTPSLNPVKKLIVDRFFGPRFWLQ